MIVTHSQLRDFISLHLEHLTGWISLEKEQKTDTIPLDVLAYTGTEYVGIDVKEDFTKNDINQVIRAKEQITSVYPNSRIAVLPRAL